MKAGQARFGTWRSQPSSSFLVAGKRSENKARGDPRHQTLCTIPRPLSHCSRRSYRSSHSLVVDRSSDDCWVCQAIVPPTTRPHRHQHSPGDRSSASQEYLRVSSQNKHPSILSTATTAPPAYRTPHCETPQRHSFRKTTAQGPAFSLPSHNPLASHHLEAASVSRRWPFQLKSW